MHERQVLDRVAPIPVLYVPAWQSRHELGELEDRDVEYVPAMQEEHWLDEFIPVPVLYLPAWHAAHWVGLIKPSPVPYVPVGQLEQKMALE